MNMVGIGVVELVILLGLGGGMGLPLGIPPGEPDPTLARVAPDECLFYVTWAGATEPDPNSANHTERLLAEPEVREFEAKLASALIQTLAQAAAKQGGPEAERLAKDAAQLAKIILTHPVAAYLADVKIQAGGPPQIRAGLVVRIGDDAAEVGRRIKQHQDALIPGMAREAEAADVTVYELKPEEDAPLITWGVKGPYLFVTLGEGEVDALASRAETAPPMWFTAAAQAVSVERPATLSYLNTKKIFALAASQGGAKAKLVLDAIGLSNVTAVASATGLDGDGFIHRTLVRVEGQPTGIMSVTSGQKLSPADLRPIPADATFALAVSFRPERLLQTIRDAVGKVEPRAGEEFDNGIARIEQQFGMSLQDDILQSLGDTWCVYSSPSQGGLTGVTAVIQIRDSDRFAAAHAKLLAAANTALGRGQGPEDGPPAKPTLEQISFDDRDIHYVNARQPGFPLAPAWCLDGDQLVVSTFPQNVRAYLSRGEGTTSLAENSAVAATLGSSGDVFKLVYQDTVGIFDRTYPLVPFVVQAATSQLQRQGIDIDVSALPSAAAIRQHLQPGLTVVRRHQLGVEMVSRQTLPGANLGVVAPAGVGLLLPAVTSAREAARRAQSTNNLKQIALGMLNHESVYQTFPAACMADQEGKPLLSWRVAILPLIEEDQLYRQFHLDEPWDSEHNQSLMGKMPPLFLAPGSRHTAAQGKTNYLTVRGDNTAFPGTDATKLAQISDGTSMTIMVVEVNDQTAVPWTKPEDFTVSDPNPTAGLVGLRHGGFLAAFCDGSVRFLAASIDRATLKALFTRNGGEVVDSSKLK
jgi:hypothetical protein